MTARAGTALVCGLMMLSTACSTSVGLMEPASTAPAPARGAVNKAPTAKIDTTARGSNTGYQLRVNAYDPDGDTLAIEWSATEGTFSSATTARTVWTPAAETKSATITVKVTDTAGVSASDTTTIVVRAQP